MNLVSTFNRQIFELAGATPEQLDSIRFTSFGTEDFFKALADAECLFTSSLFDLDKKIIDAAPKLKLIQTMGVGYNQIDLAYTAARKVYACNNKAANSFAVAEFTVALMLASLRRVPHYERRVYKGEFKASLQGIFTAGLHSLGSRKVGLIGFGDIAADVAKDLSGFGCEIYYYNRNRRSEAVEREYNVTYLPLDELLRTCNVISLHVPSAPETVGLIGEKEFAMMPEGTLFINTARGEIVDLQAMINALTEGHLMGAAVDVTYPEPPPEDYPLLHLPPEVRERLIFTPHIGGATVESIQNSIGTFFYNVECVARHKTPKNVVNGLV